MKNMSSFARVKVCKMNNVIAWVYAPQWKEKAKNEVKQGATLSPSQTTAQLASLLDFFFRPLLIYFSPFSATAEPCTRLLMLGFISPLPG